MPRMMRAPTAPSGFLRTKVATCPSQPICGASGAEAVASIREVLTLISVVADAGVEPRVGEVDQEVHDHEAERDEEHQGLHYRVVSVGHRVHHEAAHAVQGEDGLGDHEAADEECE